MHEKLLGGGGEDMALCDVEDIKLYDLSDELLVQVFVRVLDPPKIASCVSWPASTATVCVYQECRIRTPTRKYAHVWCAWIWAASGVLILTFTFLLCMCCCCACAPRVNRHRPQREDAP